jgi:hypothetical protein
MWLERQTPQESSERYENILNFRLFVQTFIHVRKELQQYREQGTVQECAAALAHYQAFQYAEENLPE